MSTSWRPKKGYVKALNQLYVDGREISNSPGTPFASLLFDSGGAATSVLPNEDVQYFFGDTTGDDYAIPDPDPDTFARKFTAHGINVYGTGLTVISRTPEEAWTGVKPWAVTCDRPARIETVISRISLSAPGDESPNPDRANVSWWGAEVRYMDGTPMGNVPTVWLTGNGTVPRPFGIECRVFSRRTPGDFPDPSADMWSGVTFDMYGSLLMNFYEATKVDLSL